MNLIVLGIIFAGGVALTIGDLIMKKWVVSGSLSTYIIGLLTYVVGMVFLSQSFKFKNIAVASMIMVIFNIITLLVVSWFLYQEKISLIQLIGFAFGIIAIIILELK